MIQLDYTINLIIIISTNANTNKQTNANKKQKTKNKKQKQKQKQKTKNKSNKSNNKMAALRNKLLMNFFKRTPEQQFHPNQIKAAKEVLSHFKKDNRYVMLSAQMQSGKTGCAFYVAFEMLLEGKIDKLFIMSGSSETELREQWREKYPEHLACFCQERGLKWHQDNKLVKELGKKVESGIIWRQDLLKKTDMFTDRFLIIWDESHFATTEQQTLHRFFEQVGIMNCMQGDTTYLRSTNAYILSVTATRCAEQSRFVGANDGRTTDDWNMVVMEPGKAYRGVQFMKRYGHIKPALPINETNMTYLQQIFEQYKLLNKYMVIRCNSSSDLLVSCLAKQMGIPVVRYNMNTKKTVDVDMVLSEEPEQFTLFLIRGMLRMGKEMHKEHIVAVYESAVNSKTNTTLQGLLGRTCGYYTDELEEVVIDVYLPNGVDNDSLNQYITSIESGFTIGISGTQLVPKTVRHRSKRTHLPFHIPKNALSGQYSCLGENVSSMQDGKAVVCGDLLEMLVSTNLYDFSTMSANDKSQILSTLTSASQGNHSVLDEIKVENTHKSIRGESVLKTTSKKHVPFMDEAIKQKRGVTSWKTGKDLEKAIRILKIDDNSGLEMTNFNEGDLVIIFNTDMTDEEQTNEKLKTTGKDIFHTDTEPTTNTQGPDDNGVAKCRLPDEVKHDVGLFKRALTELIGDYLDETRVVIQSSGCGTGKVAFSKEQYKNLRYMNGILRSIEEHFHGNIKINIETMGRGRPAADEVGCLRLRRVWWERV